MKKLLGIFSGVGRLTCIWVLRVALCTPIVFLLSACSLKTDGMGQLDEPTGEMLTNARLWTGEGRRTEQSINPSAFNRYGQPATISGLEIDYVDYLNPDQSYRGSPAERAELQMIRAAGGRESPASGTLRVKFENDSLDFFVRQMLGGFLGVNYIIGDPLEGTVTFVTEEPIVKSQVLPIVRSVLARNGYVLKLVGGVFHIARPETISALEANQKLGESATLISRIVELGRPIASNLKAALEPTLPEGSSLTPSTDNMRLIVQAPQEEVSTIVTLIEEFAEDSGDRTVFALIRVRQTSPKEITESLSEFFGGQAGRNVALPISVIALESQASLLVSASDNTALNNVRKLVTQLDQLPSNSLELRIIPLRNVAAEEIGPQLSKAFDASFRQGSSAAKKKSADEETSESDSDTENQSEKNNKSETDAEAEEIQGKSSTTIVADERNNALLVRSTYKTFLRIQEAVQLLDIPLAQVVIEVTILEVVLNQTLQFGVQWYLSGSGFTVRSSDTALGAFDPGGQGFAATLDKLFGNVTVQAVIDALDQVSNVKIISSPYLTVRNKSTAKLVVGDQIPYAKTTQTSSSGGETVITEDVEILDTGVVLNVTPVIRGDNSVELTISQEHSTPQQTTAANELTPTISTRSVDSEVIVQSGQTALLGGLIQENATKTNTGVPSLKRIPILGYLFQQSTSQAIRTELLMMITPRVVRHHREIEKITNRLRGHMTVR